MFFKDNIGKASPEELLGMKIDDFVESLNSGDDENKVGKIVFAGVQQKPLWCRVEDLEEEVLKLKEDSVWMLREMKKLQESVILLSEEVISLKPARWVGGPK